MNSRYARQSTAVVTTIALFVTALAANPAAAQSQRWVATWATSPATFYQYVTRR